MSPPGLEVILLRVALVGYGVNPMESHRPQLCVDDVPLFVGVPV